MNQHRLYRKSKKIYGRGFFQDLVTAIGKEVKPIVEDKSKEFVKNKLDKIFMKKKGGGLKIFKSK